jgi:hypothetical protein
MPLKVTTAMIFKIKRLIGGITLFALSIVLFACNDTRHLNSDAVYSPKSQELYNSIVRADSLVFAAYNNCEMEKFADCFSENIEFYHDQGGLMTSKDSILAATKKNICGKVTRVLIKGSIEVYPIAGYGAVEMGKHYFINNQEPKPVHPQIGKFIHTWKNENPQDPAGGKWRLTRVISLH